MDQSEIDALLSNGNSEEYDQKQQGLIDNLTNIPSTSKLEDVPIKPKNGEVKQGKVMGQLSRVSEEAEEGTTLVMNYLENVLNIASKQKQYVSKLDEGMQTNTLTNTTEDIIAYFKDSSFLIEDLVFNAMDAFQFQDINRQKLMKVMHTLSQLNNYLNDLLGDDESEKGKPVNFGKNIESKTLTTDLDKQNVDDIVAQFKSSN